MRQGGCESVRCVIQERKVSRGTSLRNEFFTSQETNREGLCCSDWKGEVCSHSESERLIL